MKHYGINEGALAGDNTESEPILALPNLRTIVSSQVNRVCATRPLLPKFILLVVDNVHFAWLSGKPPETLSLSDVEGW